jgi:hypothetical protein
MKIYLITHVTHDPRGYPLYWNNKMGWVDLEEADVFTQSEFETLHLPIGGQWLEFQLVGK